MTTVNAVDITLPLTPETVSRLNLGDIVRITGTVYTARDAAHKRMTESLANGEPLPFDLVGQTIYYAGPAPAKPGHVVGPCGPTTSARMDAYTPQLIKAGLRGMIGKGERSDAVRCAMREYGAIYFGVVGGAAALIARCVKRCALVAYEDLGTEAVRRLDVEDLVAVVLDKG
ncbi:MAG: FumA C-terminus/TtdB family hydratase beta subunit [Oscillospiraceae bacterium]|jgi:fumarate hydratase subunit beta|nr:FumA C-terminus/TtdB family hydratase beta subunit [Oscillospiraceae bacterium]